MSNNTNMEYDVFISCKSEDYTFAEEIFNFLKENNINAFLASQELRQIGESEYRRAISEAIMFSYHMIVFASNAEYINSRWVYYEWDMFVNAKLKGRKEGQIVTILKDVKVDNINFALWKYESFSFDNYKNGLLPYVETAKSKERKELLASQSQLEAQKIEEAKKQEQERKKKELIRLAEDYHKNQSVEGKKILYALKELGISFRVCPVCNERIPLSKTFCTNCGWLFSPIQGIQEVGYLADSEEHLTLCKELYQGRINSKHVHLISEPTIPITPRTISKKDEDPLTFTVKGVPFMMVKVNYGTFTMEATAERGDDADKDESPTCQVTLSDFYLGQTVVTQELWKAVMSNNPSKFKGDNLPVERVSWKDCQIFIEKLNDMLSSQLGEMHFALPTEAQWEFAARGGNKSKGYKYAGSNSINDVAWYNDNSGIHTHPVAQKRPNELGLYDMSGNVWEWCQDKFCRFSNNAQRNPEGPADGWYRVFRGGSFYNGARSCRVSDRCYIRPDFRNSDLGLRLCLLPK